MLFFLVINFHSKISDLEDQLQNRENRIVILELDLLPWKSLDIIPASAKDTIPENAKCWKDLDQQIFFTDNGENCK